MNYKIFEIYAQHDKNQIEALKTLANKINDYYIITDIARRTDGLHYDFIYKNKVVGTSSSKKIDKWLNGASLSKTAKLRIHHFRFSDSNNHYSKAIITKRIVL